MCFLGIALHEALGMDIKWRSARHSAAMNQLELSEIEKTLRFGALNLKKLRCCALIWKARVVVITGIFLINFFHFLFHHLFCRAAIKVSEKVTKQSMTKLNGADDDEKTIQEFVIIYHSFHSPFAQRKNSAHKIWFT